MIAVNRDDSMGKALEEERIHSKVLENDLKKEQDLSAFKDRILSTVSHEFRTPLAVIQSSVDILRKFGNRLSPEQTDERLQKISRQINRLVHLMNDVVELGRGNPQKPNPSEAIALRDFCAELAEEYRLLHPNHVIQLHMGEVPPIFKVERRILEHILMNLLSNAIKYSPEGSDVTLSAYEEGANLVFRVDDAGIGIPAEEQAHIFDSFYRAQNVGTIQGTGIGLAIVKQNVNRLDGTIEFSSQHGKGSSFIVKLPLSNAPVVEKEADSV
jgi:signal transduction histidine kinase